MASEIVRCKCGCTWLVEGYETVTCTCGEKVKRSDDLSQYREQAKEAVVTEKVPKAVKVKQPKGPSITGVIRQAFLSMDIDGTITMGKIISSLPEACEEKRLKSICSVVQHHLKAKGLEYQVYESGWKRIK